MRTGHFASFFAVQLAITGCAVSPDDVGERSSELVTENGRNLNGRNLNGRNLNGSSLGTVLLWTSFEGVLIDGIRLDETWLEASEFHGKNASGQFSGTDFVGSEFKAQTDYDETVRLRITHIEPAQTADGSWRYMVEYRDTDQAWYPICQDDTGALPAIAINGWWDPREGVEGGGGKVDDPTKFTFACERIGALGKCVEIGYRPWASASDAPLDEHHQGCVRLLRNDYCGDGTPHTTDNNLVNLYDGVGIQDDTEDWVIEAEWDAAGARCFSPQNRAVLFVPCYDERVSLACGSRSNFETGTLLMSETP